MEAAAVVAACHCRSCPHAELDAEVELLLVEVFSVFWMLVESSVLVMV